MKHVMKNMCHDESGIWCDRFQTACIDDVEDPSEADCPKCLDAVMAYATKAMNRKFELVEQRIAEAKKARDP